MKRFKKILYVLNEPVRELLPSLNRAISLAKNNQADLTVLYVVPKFSMSPYSKNINVDDQVFKKSALESAEEGFQAQVSSFDKDIKIHATMRIGKKYMETIRCVLSENFDLVIKETDKPSWLDRFIGSDDMHLLRKCPCPVWMMKKDEKINYDQIMAAVDFDTDNAATCNDELNAVIMELSSSLSISDFASEHVVNVYDVPEEGFISMWTEQPEKVRERLFESELKLRRKKMDILFDQLKTNIGPDAYDYLSPIPHIVQGLPDREIPRVAKEIKADLVVMGTVARTGIKGVVIGNTAESILSQLECSVLAVKPKAFVSPISI